MSIRVDDQRLWLPADLSPDATYDVLLNGQHVWSIDPGRDTVDGDDGTSARWPKALRSHLKGRATVVVRSHVGEEEVGEADHVFGDVADREVAVVDKTGAPLVLDKYNRLTRPLSAEGDDVIDAFLDQVDALLTALRDKAGVPAFVSYGTLLGAVRDGELIGHDNDVDISYVSERSHPVDVVREGFRVERVLAAEGWLVRRGAGTRLNVRLPQDDGTLRFVDVFTAHWVEGVLYMPQDTGFELPREAILPLTTVELHGRPFPAPADSERLLAETYGAGWRTPDPSFKYETPLWLSRRIAGWFGGLRVDRKVWDAFYAGQWRKLPEEPSSFARWVAEHHPAGHRLVDVGTGNGRDAYWFATEHGRDVVALDYSMGIMNRGANRLADDRLRREVLNLNDYRHVVSLGTRLLLDDDGPVDVYGRLLLEAVDEHGRDHVLRLAAMLLRRGGRLFLEFRTDRDRRRPHHFRNPRRRYLSPDDVVAEIRARGGQVVDRVEGTGLAPFHDEDPHVCRLVATWPTPARRSSQPSEPSEPSGT